jgi:hypothetical protein
MHNDSYFDFVDVVDNQGYCEISDGFDDVPDEYSFGSFSDFDEIPEWQSDRSKKKFALTSTQARANPRRLHMKSKSAFAEKENQLVDLNRSLEGEGDALMDVITEVPEEDSFVCPGQPAKKIEPIAKNSEEAEISPSGSPPPLPLQRYTQIVKVTDLQQMRLDPIQELLYMSKVLAGDEYPLQDNAPLKPACPDHIPKSDDAMWKTFSSIESDPGAYQRITSPETKIRTASSSHRSAPSSTAPTVSRDGSFVSRSVCSTDPLFLAGKRVSAVSGAIDGWLRTVTFHYSDSTRATFAAAAANSDAAATTTTAAAATAAFPLHAEEHIVAVRYKHRRAALTLRVLGCGVELETSFGRRLLLCGRPDPFFSWARGDPPAEWRAAPGHAVVGLCVGKDWEVDDDGALAKVPRQHPALASPPLRPARTRAGRRPRPGHAPAQIRRPAALLHHSPAISCPSPFAISPTPATSFGETRSRPPILPSATAHGNSESTGPKPGPNAAGPESLRNAPVRRPSTRARTCQ